MPFYHRLQQIHIKDMYEMIEHGLRGGMTQCSFEKVEANNNMKIMINLNLHHT